MEPQAAILLPDQDYCTSPWSVQLPDSTNIQHLLDMGLHIVIHVGTYTLVAFFEGYPIHYLCFMLDQSSFAQVKVTACKQVFLFEQQFSGLLLLWFGPFFKALEVQGLQDPSLLGFQFGTSGCPGWKNYWWYLVGRGNQPSHSLCGNFHDMSAQVVETDRYPRGPQMQFSVGHHRYYCCGQLGTWHWFHEHMDLHTVYFDTQFGVHTNCAEWGDT